MYITNRLKLLFIFCWFGILSFLYAISTSKDDMDAKNSLIDDTLEANCTSTSENILVAVNYYRNESAIENPDYLINTPGCFIPNYLKTYKIVEDKVVKESTCGARAVFINKVSNEEIAFTINEVKMKTYTKGKKYSCCYQFGTPSTVAGKEDYTQLRYSNCKHFKNNDKVELKNEVVSVTCVLQSSKKYVIYEDAYIILKKLNVKAADDEKKRKNPWNVLVLGMDTVSRARIYSSMPKTVKYMLQNDWLDYRGYQKVGYNTFPNVMALLTGKKMSTVYRTCSPDMDHCNHLLIWSEYKKAGYVTATGEEYVNLPDTFAKYGYKSSPTDHYMRPLFLTGESIHGNIICTKKRPSANHVLDYASIFTETYKEDNFFGFFWLNSYSHNLNNVLTLIDEDIVNFFSKLNKTGVLDDTFVYFLSDHGLRTGKLRVPYESYYDERLPMLFLWVPTKFRNFRVQEYNNLKTNQHRLITPYDLYLTLYDTLASETSTEINSEACPNCTSIFNAANINRTCEQAGVDEIWCTCHEMTDISHKDDDVVNATELSVTYIQKKISTIETKHCMKCEMLKLKKILRSHTYRDEYRNSSYFVIAFVMSPGDVAYEVTVVKDNETLKFLRVNTISVYNVRGSCAIKPNDREFCVCANTCNKKH